MKKRVPNKTIKSIVMPIIIGGFVGGFVGGFIFSSRDDLFSMMCRIGIMIVAMIGSILIAKAIKKQNMGKEVR